MTRLRSVDQNALSDLLLLDAPKAVRATRWLRDNLGMSYWPRCRLVARARQGKQPVVLPGLQYAEAELLAGKMAAEAGMTAGIRLTV